MPGLFSFLKNKRVLYVSFPVAAFGVTCLIKDQMQGGQFIKDISAEGKVCIVTGSNTGIGKETVRGLAKRGAHVYMACRNMQKCEETKNEIILDTLNKHVYCRECDLASLESVRRFCENFKKEENRLDVLINNAGVMRCPRILTQEGFEMQLGVNHMGHFLLTNLLLDLLKKSAPSRVIVVSSLAHTQGEINVTDLNSEKSYDPTTAYNQSKLANVLFTKELAKRLEGTGVTANALHPGVVDTDIIRHMSIFNSFLSKIFVKPLLWPFVKTPRSGAQTSIYAALDPELEKVSGQYFSDCELREVATAAENDDLAKWLWSVSQKWTKLKS